jgi:hypothetical protein
MQKAMIVAAFALSLAVPANASQSNYRAANTQIIMHVFGPVHGPDAVRVARCESGLSVWARNGQYLGLFQMGSRERSIYGHGNNAWAQSRAAKRYFVATDRSWSPWTCKP